MSGIKELLFESFVDMGILDAVAELFVGILSVCIWILIGMIATKISKFSIFRFVKAKGDSSRAITVSKLVASISKYVIWFVVFVVILGELKVNIAPFLASAGILGIVIGFGAQEMVRDFFSGFFIIFEDIFEIGDVIEVNGFKGTVIDITLRTTRTQNYKGEIRTVNNGDVKNVTNYSKNASLAIIDFGVAYDTNLLKLREDLEAFLPTLQAKHIDMIDNPEFLGVMSLDDSCVSMRIIAKTENYKHFGVERYLRSEIVTHLTETGVEIPFPQVVVHNA